MKIACTVTPALGHWHPTAAVLLAAKAAGHEVRVFTARSFVPTISNDGFVGSPCGVDWTAATSKATLPSLARAENVSEHLEIFYTQLAPVMFRDALRHFSAWTPDLIVHDSLEFAGVLLGEVFDCPSLAVGVTPRLTPGIMAYYGGELQQRLRTGLRLSQGKRSGRTLYLDYSPPSLKPRALHPPHDEITCRASAWRGEHRSGLQARIASSAGIFDGARPLIHLTFGTIYNSIYRQHLIRFVDALVRLPIDLIVSGLPERTLEPRENLIAHTYIPHDFLDMCDLVVCHSGYGTVLASLLAGVPTLLLPFTPDQALTAQVCRLRGVSESVTNAHRDLLQYCNPQSLRASQVCAQVERMLAHPANLNAVYEVKREIASLPPVEAALQALVQLA